MTEIPGGKNCYWYADELFPVPFALDQTHEQFPDKFLLYTEASSAPIYIGQKMVLPPFSLNMEVCFYK